MFKYRSKCRWNMLLHINGNIVEIRPGELFESNANISSRYLELITKPITTKKRGKPKKAVSLTTFQDKINGSSST